MRAVVQRVSRASVTVDGQVKGSISRGFLVLLGAGSGDLERDAIWLANKVVGLRIFEDQEGKMNLGIGDVDGAILLVSQFTLYGDCRKGRRPSFVQALEPVAAERLLKIFADCCTAAGVPVEQGVFGAHMHVELVNDGPVTLQLDTDHLSR